MELLLKGYCLLSLLMVFYVYAGYPLSIFFLSLMMGKRVSKKDYFPTVTLVSAAYNEAAIIGKSIENKLQMDYPPEKMEYIIVSDASDDGTDDIVRQYASRGVTLLRQGERMGKTAALNLAARKASGEILVFADANSMFERETLRRLLQNFHDTEVGYVTGKMIYVNESGAAIGDGCSSYMRYENTLRTYETRLGSIVGVDGGVDAVRRRLYSEMKNDQLPDFVLPLHVVAQGYRVVYEPSALLKEGVLSDTADEYKMRVRVALRAFWALRDMRHLLFPERFGLFSWQLWSHKVLRYLCFIFLASAFFSNLMLWDTGALFLVTLCLQVCLYLGALGALVLEKKGVGNRLLTLCHYFVVVNLASAHAFMKYLWGQKVVIWNPRKG
ncbi:glycosyl transferase [Desulfoluna limicola]|uniref:Glycosyl transferase n=1 Tax=Desulfoluna limicola TaxID=2810562 RepID=A0ABM7PJ37_9BACT|nr:glycosyltransferase family 2 protein [Desulfoluna limicola]BCS97099.1 glycosyl transferase [Desulfoluna limicola]